MSIIIKQDVSVSAMNKRLKQGYTLPEVVICLAILTLTLGSLWQGVQLTAKTYLHSRENQMVIQLAQQLCYGENVTINDACFNYDLKTRPLGRRLLEKLVTITSPERQWSFYYVQRQEK